MEQQEPKQSTRREGQVLTARWISLLIFFLGIAAFAGADSYKDFYLEIKAKTSGVRIDYQNLAEFCGWTGGPLPGESDLEYGMRAVWNMLSPMLGMTVISVLLFALIFGGIFGIFYLSGAFK